MKKHLLILGLASVFAITGCAGISKVDYAKFKEKVEAACEKTPEVKEVSIKGKIDGAEVKFTAAFSDAASNTITLAKLALDDANKGAAYTLAMAMKTPYAVAEAGEDEKTSYYVGAGFKVKSEDGVAEWRSNTLLASYKSTVENHEAKLSFTWKKA